MGAIALVGVALSGKRWQRLLALPALAATVAGLVASGSVSGMFAAMFGTFVLVALRALKLRYLVLSGMLVVPALAYTLSLQAGADGALNPIERVMLTLGLLDDPSGVGVSSSESRFDTYRTAIAGIADRGMLGHGLDTQSMIVDGVFPAHNLFIGSAYGGGLALALLIAWAVFRPFAGGWIWSQHDRLVASLVAVGSTSIIFAMTAPSLYNRYLWIPLAIVWAGRQWISHWSSIELPGKLRTPRHSISRRRQSQL